jgi:subtilisin family serine protease
MPSSSLKMSVWAAAAASSMIAGMMAACGGGGGGSTMPPPPPTPTPTPISHVCVLPDSAHTLPLAYALSTKVGRYTLRSVQRAPRDQSAIAPGVVGVRFSARDASSLAAAVRRVGGTGSTAMSIDGAATISLPAGVDPARAAAALRSMPGVVASNPIALRYPMSGEVIPTDPLFGTLPYDVTNPGVNNPSIQWDMYIIKMPQAWSLATGFGSSSVKIAIIDTGYDTTNADLTPGTKVAAHVVFDKGTGLPDGAASVQDHDGHGTDVSGIAAADTNNATDVAGTAGNTTLLEARVFPTPSAGNPNPGANTEDVGAAIRWAVTNGANVISMSLGSSVPDDTFEEPAVAFAIAQGVTVVAAAGNETQASLDYPAADPGVIAVGASALCDQAAARDYGTSYEYVASYSNWVPNPAASEYYVVAPGGDPSSSQGACGALSCIDFLQWVTNLYSNTAFTNAGEVILIAGTSQATPHVAGLAALMLAKDPTLTPAQIGQIISTSTDNIADNKQGHGRVDALTALSDTP